MNNSPPHTHKYKLTNLASRGREPYLVYKCESCSHYVATNLALGRATICWSCGKEFRMTQKQITRRIVKPKCPEGCKAEEINLPLPLPVDFGE